MTERINYPEGQQTHIEIAGKSIERVTYGCRPMIRVPIGAHVMIAGS
jgi:hypothetical protein